MLPPVVVSPLAPMALEPEPEELVSVDPVPLAPIVLPLESVLPLAPIVLVLESVLPLAPVVLLLEPVLPLAPIVLLEPLLAVSLGLVPELVEAESAVPEEPGDPEVCATAMPPSARAAAAASAVSVCLVVIICYSLNENPEGRGWKKPAYPASCHAD